MRKFKVTLDGLQAYVCGLDECEAIGEARRQHSVTGHVVQQAAVEVSDEEYAQATGFRSVEELAEDLVVGGETLAKAGDKVELTEDGGAVVLPKDGAPEDSQPEGDAPPVSEVDAIRNYLAEHGSGVTNKAVIEALAATGVSVSSSQVSRVKSQLASK